MLSKTWEVNYKNKNLTLKIWKLLRRQNISLISNKLDNLIPCQYKDVNKINDVYQNKLIEIIDKNAPYISLWKNNQS